MGDVKHKGQAYSVDQLGIKYSKNVLGEDRLTVVLQPNPLFGTGQLQAVFDESTRQWDIELTSKPKFGIGKTEVYEPKEALASTKSEFRKRSVAWTRGLPQTEHIDRFLHDVDWSLTALGPLESWSMTLQVFINLVFADDEPAVIFWGDDLCALYNVAYHRLVTDRLVKAHEMLGTPFVQMWPELWNDFKPMLDSIAARGVGIETLEVNLFPAIEGIIEETFWHGSFLPIRDESGAVQGFYNRARETTKSVVNDRRAKLLSTISAKPNIGGDFVYQHLVNCFNPCERDFPLAFVYSAHQDPDMGRCNLKYQSGIGLPSAGHPLVPVELELLGDRTGFVPYFRKAKSKDGVLVLHQDDGTLPESLIAGFRWRGFGEQSKSIAILPLSTSDRLLAILVLGLNPRRPFDEDYEGFLNTLQRSISATVASAVDREEARFRAERLAKQLENSEKSIREIAEYGPVGIARYSTNATVAWANDQYYEITGHGRASEDHYKLSFIDIVADEDRGQVERLWSKLSTEHEKTSAAVRLKKTWQPPWDPDNSGPEDHHVWVLASGYPIMEGNTVKDFAVSVTDISRFKWAEAVQTRSAAAAKEAKRLQENFIDMVSHEMRNPLSAITQLADAVSMSLQEYESTRKRDSDARAKLETNVENANTILLCAAHQKRVIDDVLTLSKLDSTMLSITPIAVQPFRTIEGTLKMFEAEFKANSILVEHKKSNSYLESKIDWVYLDPSRLTQIFINLITNAVKFTKLEEVRKITITVSASAKRPTSLAGVKWFPSHRTYKDLTVGSEWGKGDVVYIGIEIKDTGRGLEQDEMKKLFGRFQQANEHLKHQYGGSGLGLFISRELTETQGGEIGVKSEPRKGTTFAFYVKARKAMAPKDPVPDIKPAHDTRAARGELQRAREKQETQKASHASGDESAGEAQLCVLLVEDNIVNSRILKEQLKRAGCEVFVANHGVEALELLDKSQTRPGSNEARMNTFDVVLMDVEMPIMDGLTCTRRIRQLESEGKFQGHTKIIAVSANGRQESVDMAIQAGVDDILSKPFLVKECMAKIRTLLETDVEKTKRRRRG